MRYIINRQDAGWDLQPYFAYLQSVRADLTESVRAFACNAQNYDIESHGSLHDAWLEHVIIRETAAGQRKERRGLLIETCYLGPFHNVRIHLTYKGVAAYSLTNPAEFAAPPSHEVGHGDLLLHEIRVVDSGLFEHELEFSRGSIFLIRFSDLEHRLEPCSQRL